RAVELVAVAGADVGAVVRRAAEDGVADLRGGPAVLEGVADGVTAARAADQHDPARAGAPQDRVDRVDELGALVVGPRAAGLRDGVVVARGGVGEVEGEEPLARPAVRREAPGGGEPERGGVAVAVDEEDRREVAARGRAARPQRRRGAGGGEERRRKRRGAGRR